jgi:hypothetical protein
MAREPDEGWTASPTLDRNQQGAGISLLFSISPARASMVPSPETASREINCFSFADLDQHTGGEQGIATEGFIGGFQGVQLPL